MDKMWSTWNTLLVTSSSQDRHDSRVPSSSNSSTDDSLPPFGSSRSPSPSESIPPDRLRIYKLFCQKEKPKLEAQFPGIADKDMRRRLREAWELLSPNDKNAYLLNFAPPPEKPLPLDGEESCPARDCSLSFDPSVDRQFIMKHWFKEHSISQLHVLYTSTLWKRRVPTVSPPAPAAVKEEEEIKTEEDSPSEVDSEDGRPLLNGKKAPPKEEPFFHNEYQPGDLVWARVGCSSFWPSIVSIDPETVINDDENEISMEVEDEFAESSAAEKRDTLVESLENGTYNRCETRRGFKFVEFHVDFFGCVQRAWVSARQMIPFTGIEDFEKYLKAYKKVYKGNFRKPNMEKWDIAVKDAQSTYQLTRIDRIKRLKHLRSKKYTITEGSRKRKRKSSDETEENAGSEQPSKKLKLASELIASIPPTILKDQKRKLTTGVKLFHLANKSNVEKEYPQMKKAEVTHALNVLWKTLGQTERKFYREELRRLLETTQASTPTPTPPPPPTIKEEPKKKERSSMKGGSKPEMVGLFKNERFCILCEEVSLRQKDLVTCSGSCGHSFHKSCLSEEEDEDKVEVLYQASWKCGDCEGDIRRCFICREVDDKEEAAADSSSSSGLIKCSHKSCSKFYHSSCLRSSSLWPQAVFDSKGLTCPAHLCHTCASDNVSNPQMKYSSKLLKCVRCPTSYHSGDFCVTAGTIQITSTAIICPKHTRSCKHINVSWCFICSKGGSLICCDLCPASFHSECLELSSLPEGKYYCQTCVSGRMPLYREVIWVKFGSYRWWPAVVVHPSELPENVNRLNHEMGNFPVKFCGSQEYAWVTHGRSFLYEKGDSDNTPGGSLQAANPKTLTGCFLKGLSEAAELYDEFIQAKLLREAKKPPLYQKIKTNRPYGDVSVYSEPAFSEVQLCNCDHKSENPCHEDSDCINRLLMVECQMSTCPARDRCQNMQFTRRFYPPLRVGLTESRGWGLFVDKAMKKGRFIIEYVGELITMEEFRNRLQLSEAAKEDENFYYMTMDSSRMIDAGPKGNIARFMNHSCDPNCETQKWTVNGDTRVGIFTLKDIPSGSELTFNYQFEAVGEVKKNCLCGAPNCSGFIGKKPSSLKQQSTTALDARKKKGRKTKLIKSWEDVCFRCYKGGEVLMCDHKTCPKVYHLKCLSRDKMPHGRWFCPWHHCVECGKAAVRFCAHCPNATCRSHEATISLHPVLKTLCNEHDEEDVEALLKYYKTAKDDRLMLTSPLDAPIVEKKPLGRPPKSKTAATSIKKKGATTPPKEPPESVIAEPNNVLPKGEHEMKTEPSIIEP